MWPKLSSDASAVRSPPASFAAAACVAPRACVYGSTPRLIRRTPTGYPSAVLIRDPDWHTRFSYARSSNVDRIPPAVIVEIGLVSNPS